MAPRGYNRYMVALGMGTHPKFARLSDAEFRAHVVGVLAIAAQARVRGCLLVGDLQAEPVDIAAAAGVPEKVAVSAMKKLMAVGVLRPDEENDCLRVHDWDEVNPPPRSDVTNATRQARYRSRNAQSNATRNGVTNASVTPPVTPPEVEVEVEVEVTSKTTTSLRSAVIECFAYWQERCNHTTAKLGSDRRAKIEARLREGYTVHDIRRAIDGAAQGAFVSDNGKRFDDIELICRNGSKLEGFMERAGATARVVPITRAPHLERMDGWKRGYPEERPA